MSRIGEKIKEIRKKFGLTQQQLAQKINVSASYITKIEKDRVGPPSLYFIEKLATTFNLNKSYLEDLWSQDKADYMSIPLRKVPVLNSISAGELLEWTDQGYPVGWADEWIEVDTGVTDPNAFALKVHGDSMEPEFKEGEYVVVSPNTQWENGDYVVVANANNEKALKKIRVNADHIVLISLNPKYEPIVLGKDEDPRVIGKVVRKVKKY